MLFGKKKAQPIPYDPAKQTPAIRQSICTGEMVGGFVEKGTGKFREVQLLRGQAEKAEFAERVGVKPEDIKTIY